MSKLQPVQLDDGTTIYIEATDDLAISAAEPETGEVGRTGQKGWGDGLGRASSRGFEATAQSFNAIESTIKTYTKHTLNAFNDAALANVDKVTLEFGMSISGGAGVPYIANGTANCNIKVTVECSFPERQVTAKITQQAQQVQSASRPASPPTAQQAQQQAQRIPPAMPQNPAAAPR